MTAQEQEDKLWALRNKATSFRKEKDRLVVLLQSLEISISEVEKEQIVIGSETVDE